jgi:hypothetical protein
VIGQRPAHIMRPMSNHVITLVIVIAAVTTMACGDAPQTPRATTAGVPPAEVVDQGACPSEGCQLATWTAREAVQLYERPAGPALDATISKGESVTALASELRATPRKAIVTRLHSSDEQQGLKIGSVVYGLYPIGEGAVAVWHDGKIKHGSLDLALRYEEPLESKPLQWAWWVQVRLGDGRIAWVQNPQRGFDGMDARAN